MLLYISITEYSQAMGTRETEQTAQLWTNEHYQTTASLLSANENSTVLFPVSLFCSMFTPLRLLLFFFAIYIKQYGKVCSDKSCVSDGIKPDTCVY